MQGIHEKETELGCYLRELECPLRSNRFGKGTVEIAIIQYVLAMINILSVFAEIILMAQTTVA